MDLQKWSHSEVEYGRKILDGGLEGVRTGREAFLQGEPLKPYLGESARKALPSAAFGAFLGVLASLSCKQSRSTGRSLFFGLAGGLIGFGAGMAWESRELTESAASEALRKIQRVRDEHWVEKHPVAYA